MSKFYFFSFAVILLAFCCVSPGNAESDEISSEGECRDDQFNCADGKCVLLAYVCDADKDCEDGSDELAEICKGNCKEGRFQCSDGTCINSRYVCTGASECEDGSDEDEKLCSNCNGDDELLIKCAASTKCIKKKFQCDSDFDCGENDPSDEDPQICDENCGGMDKRFQCPNKKCIYDYKVCDGQNNCEDGGDESDETCANCRGNPQKIKCSGSNKCYSENEKCNGVLDCTVRDENSGDLILEDFSDEENCPPRQSDEERDDYE